MASCGMIYTADLMNIGTGVQAILRFGLRNLRSCNIGTADLLILLVEMGSSAVMYVPSFIKICSGIKKLLG
jgi:hypothetical protein